MVIILGSSGFLGAHLKYAFQKNLVETLTIGRSKDNDIVIDLLNFQSLTDVVIAYRPELLINLVAITNVDFCEENPKEAIDVHVSIPFLLSNLMRQHEFKILHLSTDQVYNKLYSHELDISILNNYAKTKYLGEQCLAEREHLILRTNFYGIDKRPKQAGLVENILTNYIARKKITGFSNIYFNALYVGDLVDIIVSCINENLKGIFNVGCTSYVSKADFIEKIFIAFDLDLDLYSRGMLDPLQANALRPNFMVSDVTKFIQTKGQALPYFDESFGRFLQNENDIILERLSNEI